MKIASYTKPDLRERIKSRVMASGDGGKPGQWSARKAQLVAQKYESAGGGYSGAKTEGQKSLSKWTDQKWTTSDGKPAERKGGTTRYLPEKAWDKLSPGERSATNAKKREGSREGEQFVKNTEAAAAARKEAAYTFAKEAAERHVLARYGLLESVDRIRLKLATVHPEVKQFRRSLHALQGGHDFHGGDITGILRDGEIRPSRDGLFGRGAYFSRGAPDAAYWGRPRGLIVPSENVTQQAGRIVKPKDAYGIPSPAYSSIGDGYKVRPHDLAVHTHQDNSEILREAQRNLRVRPVSSFAYEAAHAAMQGYPIETIQRMLRDPAVRRDYRSQGSSR